MCIVVEKCASRASARKRKRNIRISWHLTDWKKEKLRLWAAAAWKISSDETIGNYLRSLANVLRLPHLHSLQRYVALSSSPDQMKQLHRNQSDWSKNNNTSRWLTHDASCFLFKCELQNVKIFDHHLERWSNVIIKRNTTVPMNNDFCII